MSDTQVPESNCLYCGKRLDGAMSVKHNRQPRPGSLSICIYCGAVTIFDEELRLRALTATEVLEVTSDRAVMTMLYAASNAIHFFKAARN